MKSIAEILAEKKAAALAQEQAIDIAIPPEDDDNSHSEADVDPSTDPEYRRFLHDDGPSAFIAGEPLESTIVIGNQAAEMIISCLSEQEQIDARAEAHEDPTAAAYSFSTASPEKVANAVEIVKQRRTNVTARGGGKTSAINNAVISAKQKAKNKKKMAAKSKKANRKV